VAVAASMLAAFSFTERSWAEQEGKIVRPQEQKSLDGGRAQEDVDRYTPQQLKNAQQYFEQIVSDIKKGLPVVDFESQPVLKHLLHLSRLGFGIEIEQQIGDPSKLKYYDISRIRNEFEATAEIVWLSKDEVLLDLAYLAALRRTYSETIDQVELGGLQKLISNNKEFAVYNGDTRAFIADYLTALKVSSSWFYAIASSYEANALGLDFAPPRVKEVAFQTYALEMKTLALAFTADPLVKGLVQLFETAEESPVKVLLLTTRNFKQHMSGDLTAARNLIEQMGVAESLPSLSIGYDALLLDGEKKLRHFLEQVKEGRVPMTLEFIAVGLSMTKFHLEQRRDKGLYDKLQRYGQHALPQN
jgi:hypothetical protein